uniref:Uncharacterized protein n=1 Tax=Oryza sativa subsp. japonica TaxID=39947 RepID=Q6K5C2_ORYSJ|nr:hypothetical protein [Oryza sativa Japonica Group]
MADSTKGNEDNLSVGEVESSHPTVELSLAIVVAPKPTVPPSNGSDNDVADEDDEYSSLSDPCPSPK